MTATLNPVSTHTTITMPLDDLRNALEWVVPVAPSPSAAPALACIQFSWGTPPAHYGKSWQKCKSTQPGLTLAATDRYRLTYSTVVSPTLSSVDTEGAICVPIQSVKAALKSMPKPSKGVVYNATLSLDSHLSTLLLSVETAHNEMTVFQAQLDKMETSFPKIEQLLPNVEESMIIPGCVLNAMFVEQFAKAARKVSEGLGFAPMNPSKAVPIRTLSNVDSSVRCSGIVMPIREAN